VLAGLAGGAPEVVEALEAAGLGSPRTIVDAGPDALAALPLIGDRADKIYAAASEWLAARAAAQAAPAPDDGPPAREAEPPAENA
jgi:hypothetical protein